MSKYDGMVPTLIVGLGGIGGRLVSRIYESLSPTQKELTSAVCIDTNHIDLGKLAKKGISTITTSSTKRVEEYLKNNPEAKSWFPENPFIAIKKLNEGAGQIRACSRLAAEASIKEGSFVELDKAIKHVRSVTGDPNLPDLKVVIVNSICGGTGAGLAVQIPYYIKYKLDYVAGAKSILFRGYFVGPSITEAKNTKYQKAANYTNAYACVKELNAIYEMQNDIDAARKLNIPFFEEVNKRKVHGDAIEIPYDFIFMFEDFNAKGLSTGGFEQQMDNISQAILTQCFSIATGDVYGGEDNFIIPRIEKNGMDRFGSMAMCKASYPYAGMLNYVASRWVADTAVKDWNAIDNEYQLRLRIANMQTNGRGAEEIGTLADFFIDRIEEEDDFSRYRKYYNQTHIITTQEIGDGSSGREMETETLMIDVLTEFIETESMHITADELFTQNAPAINRSDSVGTNYDEAISLMTKIKRDLPQLISKYSLEIVNKLLPYQYVPDIRRSAQDESLPGMLIHLHPIAARYLLYSFKKKVDQYLKDVKASLSSNTYSEENRNKIKNTDYFIKTEEQETPSEAEEAISRHIPDFLVKYMPSFKQIYNLLEESANEEFDCVANYAKLQVQKRAYEEISNRLAILIDIYERLFDSIERIGKLYTQEATDFLYMHNSDKTISHYICASADNKTELYNEVTEKAHIDFSDIPESAIQSLTTSVYDMMNQQIVNTSEKYDPDKIIREMEQLFKNTVVDSMIDVIADKTQNILNMNIFEAIKKQYWFSLDPENRPDSYLDINLEDADMIIRSILTKAEPQLKYSVDDTPEERTYWILNPRSFTGRKQQSYTDGNGKTRVKTLYYFDEVEADKALNLSSNASTEVFADEKVDKYSLTCLRAIYCLEASQMNLYKRDGKAYDAYAARINNMLGIGSTDRESLFGQGQISFVHPHIDKNWHIPTLLPALDPHEEEERQTNIVLAFLLSIALRICRITRDNSSGGAGVDRWMFYNLNYDKRGFEKILIADKPIGTGYKELMNAFAYNSAMVYNVLEFEKLIRRADIDNCSKKEFKDLKQHRIIYSLTHTNEGKDDFDTENILLSILKYYTESNDDLKLKILLERLRNYMYEYAMEVTDHINSEADIFYASMRSACIKSFESVYNSLAASSTKGARFEKLSDKERFIRESKKVITAFKQAYKSYL